MAEQPNFDDWDWEANAPATDPSPEPPPPVQNGEDSGLDEESSPEPVKPLGVPLTREDSHNADYLLREFGARVRFDHPTNRWYIWHKGAHRWKKDESKQVREMTDIAAKRRAMDCVKAGDKDGLKIAMALFSIPKQNYAIDALSFRSGVAVGQQHWDMHPDLFGVRNGVLELPTGTFRAGSPLDAITKQSPVIYDPTAACPRWMAFLREVFVTDELIEYVRVMVGYCMTGLTTEQAWFLLYGTGGNGKSVFVSILEAIFGVKEYYEIAAAETFIVTRWGPSAGHNVAQFRGARLVVASEVPESASFDGARIKQLTGSDPVTAAAKYENNVTYTPQLKLMMLVNHLPATRDDSLGFWRRLRPIPFEVSFTDSGTEDTGLLDTLLAELPGILNWAFSGAVSWYSSGLPALPANAAQLASEYRAESDPLRSFIHECIVETRVSTDVVPAREVYQVYVTWAESNKKPVMSETNFGRSSTMKTVGLGKKIERLGAFHYGIKIYAAGEHPVKMGHRVGPDD